MGENAKGCNSNRQFCKTCKWRGSGKYANSSAIGCEYSVKNGHSRGCKVDDCTVYKKGDPEKNTKPIVLG